MTNGSGLYQKHDGSRRGCRRGNGRAAVFLAGCAVSAIILGLLQLYGNQLAGFGLSHSELVKDKAPSESTNIVDSARAGNSDSPESRAAAKLVPSQTKVPTVVPPQGTLMPSASGMPSSTGQASLGPTQANASTPPTNKSANAPRPIVKVASVSLPTLPVAGTADGFDQEALATAKALVARYPNRAQALHVLALLEAQLRHSAEADKLWRKCVELAPGEDIYLTNLAANAVNRGDSEGAIEFLSDLAAKGKASPDALHNYAASLMNVGRLDEALNVIQDATQRATNSPSHWLLFGQIQLKRGEAIEAESHIRRAIELGGETSTSCFNMSAALARQGKKEEAAEYRKRYNELTKKEPITAENRYQVLSEAESRRNLITVLVEGGAIYGKNGDILKAESLLLRALALDPRELSAATSLADLYLAANMFAEERVARRRIQELTPSDFETYLRLAKASVNAGEPEAGAAVLKNAIALAPNRVEGFASLAQLYLANREPQKALYYAQEAVALQPSREGFQFVATVYNELGKPAEAEAARAEAAKLAETGRASSPTGNSPPNSPSSK